MADHVINLSAKFDDPTPIRYELERFPLVTIENAYAATAHAPNHVTRE